jgi:hypothetical protein
MHGTPAVEQTREQTRDDKLCRRCAPGFCRVQHLHVARAAEKGRQTPSLLGSVAVVVEVKSDAADAVAAKVAEAVR